MSDGRVSLTIMQLWEKVEVLYRKLQAAEQREAKLREHLNFQRQEIASLWSILEVEGLAHKHKARLERIAERSANASEQH